MSPIRVKICGLTDPANAREVATAGAWAVGLNFYPRSKRFVSDPVGREIVEAISPHVLPVGLFVNATDEDVARRVRDCRLGCVQFHGDESPDDLARFQQRFPDVQLWRAFPYGSEGLEPVLTYLKELERRQVRLDGCLFDACQPGSYGGTGHTLPWRELRRELSAHHWPLVILAGGLNPHNVTAALEAVQPDAIDLASGIEISPGRKDVEQVAAVIRQARAWSEQRDATVS